MLVRMGASHLKPGTEVLAATCTAWHTAYEKTLVPHSPVVTAKKKPCPHVFPEDA
jgi:hypothetical protein